MDKQKIAYAVAGIVLVAILFFVSSKQIQSPTHNLENTSQQEEQESSKRTISMIIENSQDVLVANLEDVSDGTSTGTGRILRQDGLIYHTVNAQLPEPDEDFLYEGWLVNEDEGEFISTGVMQQDEDGRYLLEYMADNSYEGYDLVVITLEEEIDETPEEHILEGLAQ